MVKRPTPQLAGMVEQVVIALVERDGSMTYPALLIELGMRSVA